MPLFDKSHAVFSTDGSLILLYNLKKHFVAGVTLLHKSLFVHGFGLEDVEVEVAVANMAKPYDLEIGYSALKTSLTSFTKAGTWEMRTETSFL